MQFAEDLQELAAKLMSVETITVPPGVDLGEVDLRCFEKNAQAVQRARTMGQILELSEINLGEIYAWLQEFGSGPYIKSENLKALAQSFEKLSRHKNPRMSLMFYGLGCKATELSDAHRWNVRLWNNIEAIGGTVFGDEMRFQSEQRKGLKRFLEKKLMGQ